MPNGILAVQIPKNGDSPLYKSMDEVIENPKWGFSKVKIDYNMTLDEDEYFDILSSLTDDFSIWETVYFRRMPTYESLVEWIRGTKLRPYLNVLDDIKKQELEKEIVDKIRSRYKRQENGEIIYRFKRLFYIAKKID